jgi:hypothetical protein
MHEAGRAGERAAMWELALIYLAGCMCIACLVTTFETIWDDPDELPKPIGRRVTRSSGGTVQPFTSITSPTLVRVNRSPATSAMRPSTAAAGWRPPLETNEPR